MIEDTAQVWIVMIVLGLGTFLLRFSFLGMIGSRPMPLWALRLLRYTPVAVLPGLVAPMVLWPAATCGETDPARLAAACAAVAMGLLSRNVFAAIFAGAAALYLTPWLLG